MKLSISSIAFTFSLVISFHAAIFSQSSEFQYAETKQLVALVSDAAKLIEEKGEDSFEELSMDNSKWRHDEIYIFVLDFEGVAKVHINEDMIGKSQNDLLDVNGKPFIRWFIYEVIDDDGGWSHYLWVKPGHIFPTWKTAYIKSALAPSGNKYVVGCGLYNMKMEETFVVDQVNDAVDLIKREKEEAFDVLRDKKSEFIFRSTYVFVYDCIGTLLVMPPFPNLEGTNMYNYTDASGNYLFREFLKVLGKGDSGWVEYSWPKPTEYEPSKTRSYIQRIRVEDHSYIVGGVLYSD